MSETEANGTTAPSTTVFTESRTGATAPDEAHGFSIWRKWPGGLGFSSAPGRAKAMRTVGAFAERHWILTASLALLVAAPTARFGKELFESRPFAARGQRSAPLTPPSAKMETIASPMVATMELPASSTAEAREDSAAEVDQEPAEPTDLPPYAPMIARTVSLALVSKDFSSSRGALQAILTRHHGYAASLTANTRPNEPGSLQASLRIPAAELSAAVAELKSLGEVLNETQSGEEVTQQHADLVARLKNSRETEHRLQAILEQRTGKVTEVLGVEREIARVRGEIEQMEAEQKSLEHRVDFATVELSILEQYKATISSTVPSFSIRLHNALVSGYRDAVETLASLLLFIAADGPSLLLWLAFLLPVVWFVRRRWLRQRATAPASA